MWSKPWMQRNTALPAWLIWTKLSLLREKVRNGKHLVFDQNFFFDHS